MTTIEICEVVAKDMAKELDCEVQVKESEKGGIKRYGVAIDQGTISPIIYYKDGETAEQYKARIREILDNGIETPEIGVDLSNWDDCKGRLFPKVRPVVKDTELIAFPFLDMEVTVSLFIVKNEQGIQSIPVNRSLAENWGVMDSEILEAAIENIKDEADFKSMAEVMAGFGMPAELFLGDVGMYILSNESCVYGANQILNSEKLAEISRETFGGEDFLILPSSIHEILLIATDMTDSPLASMIQEINESSVRPEEVLSSHPYRFNAATCTVEVEDETEKASSLSA